MKNKANVVVACPLGILDLPKMGSKGWAKSKLLGRSRATPGTMAKRTSPLRATAPTAHQHSLG
jgi:hypothetical protein